MKKSSDKKTGRYYLMLLTGLLAVSELIFKYVAASEVEETLVKILIVGVPLIFVFNHYKWAKYLASVILILNGCIALIGSYMLELEIMYIVGLFNIFFAVVLHTSKSLRQFFAGTDQIQANGEERSTLSDVKNYNYPYLLTRYKAALIDSVFLFVIFAMLMTFTNTAYRPIASIIYLVIVVMYEPLMLVLFSGTIGHKSMNIRVKSASDTAKNINLLQGIIRSIVKIGLGWFSLLIINFNSEHRAIHDYLSSSVVLDQQKTEQ